MIEKLVAFLSGNGVVYALFGAVLVGAALGGGLCKLYYDTQLAVLEASIARERQASAETHAAATSDALARLQAAQLKGDALAAQVAAAETARLQLAQEKDREIARLTTGRACLDGSVVRLLNRDQGSGIRDQLPAPTGFAFGTDSAAAADTADFASDTDIALWARHARDQHDACRERISALRTWFAD
jgi:hypothetical protein